MTISENLIKAYESTDYVVNGTPKCKLQINKYSHELDALHKHHGVSCSAFLTAHNPFSVSTAEEINRTLQDALVSDLTSLSLHFIDGYGQSTDANADWKESSFLVLGLDLENGRKLAVKYRQNAFVWSDKNCIPKLIITQ
jgi:Protein of unknown function (DUF3293)